LPDSLPDKITHLEVQVSCIRVFEALGDFRVKIPNGITIWKNDPEISPLSNTSIGVAEYAAVRDVDVRTASAQLSNSESFGNLARATREKILTCSVSDSRSRTGTESISGIPVPKRRQIMHRSEGRFLTTHVGSLPRSPQLLAMLLAKEQGANVDESAFRHQIEHDLKRVVDHQYRAGIDIVGDGELPRIGFSFYVKDRMSGFGGVAKRGTVNRFRQVSGFCCAQAGLRQQARQKRNDLSGAGVRSSNRIRSAPSGRASGVGCVRPSSSNLRRAIPRDLRHRRNSGHHFDHSTALS
jgi:hypothetical protein